MGVTLLNWMLYRCREKRELEQRLAATETQRQAKEIGLSKLQKSYDEMKLAAADAQARVQALKVADGSNQFEHTMQPDLSPFPARKARTGDPNGEQAVLRVDRFLRTLKERVYREPEDVPVPNHRAVATSEHTADNQGDDDAGEISSNAIALEKLKRRMSKDIKNQIATTKYGYACA